MKAWPKPGPKKTLRPPPLFSGNSKDMSHVDLALSTCWHAERTTDGSALLQEATQMGFTKVELSHNTRYTLWPGILAAHEAGQAPKIEVLHNFC
ncbi:MAG: hypothetical protein EBU36_03395, partial [Verrucomicrobia bacterium]|nr:hypothetical protein [Verrucomicrobiota bacterium]